MGIPKLTNFIISLLVIAAAAALIGGFLSSLSTNYGISDPSSNISSFNKMNELTNTIENISDSTDITEKDPNFTDILGAYFSKGFNSIKIAAKSIDIFFDMSKDAVDKSNMGASGTIILSLVVGIVTVLIFIGIILSAIVKRDL